MNTCSGIATVVIIIAIILGVAIFSATIEILYGLLFVLGIIIAYIIYKKNKAMHEITHDTDENALHVVNLDRGGVFKITGVGNKMEEMTLTVLAKHLYRQGEYYWYELECDKGDGEKIWVDIDDDDETIVSVVLEKIPFSKLGITNYRLDEIDEEERGKIMFNGRPFLYNDSDKATFYKRCQDTRPEELYYWDFVCGKHILTVEKWGENEYQVFYSEQIKPHQITIYRNKKERNK